MPTMQDADTELTHETPEQQRQRTPTKQHGRTPTKRAPRAPLLATLASAAACGLPLLAGGLAAGLGALANMWIVVPAVVAAGIGGVGLLWRRRRKQAAVREAIAGESWSTLLAVLMMVATPIRTEAQITAPARI